MRAIHGLLIFIFVFPFLVEATGTLSVPLTVKERAGVARTNEIVQAGIPLPRGAQILSVDGLSILDSTGRAMDADFVVTGRWGGAPSNSTLPIKWILATFRCSVQSNGTATFYLTDYRPNAPAVQIQLNQSNPGYWVVNTGAAQFEIATTGFNLFRRVVVGGNEIVSPSSQNGPYYTLDQNTYYANSATGGSSLQIYRSGNRNQTLTLKVKGSHRTFSTSTDDDFDFNTFLTFYAGSSIVRVHHSVQNNRPWVPLENNADFRNVGSPNSTYADEIGLHLSVNLGANPNWSVATSAPENAIQGSLASKVAVYQDNSGDSNWKTWLERRTTGNDGVSTVSNPIYGPQAYVRSDRRGYEVTNGGVIIKTGTDGTGYKMSGYLDASGANGGVTVAIRDFWQNYPKALRVSPQGRIEVALFPDEFRARHAFRVGEQKTHDILFYFHGSAAQDIDAVGKGFAKPLLALAPTSWYAETTRVIPSVSTTAPNQYRFTTVPPNPTGICFQVTNTPQEYDAFMVRHLQGPGAGTTCDPNIRDYAFDGLNEAIPASQMYSWMDYGDVPIDFEEQTTCSGATRSITGQYSWKYDGDYGLLVNFLRSGDYRFLDYGLAAAEHVADIDMLHHGKQSGRGFASFLDGGMFGHSQHNNNGDRNPHRNGVYGPFCDNSGNFNGTPLPDMLFGAGALSLAYWITGEPQLAEAVVDVSDWLVFFAPTYPAYVDGARAGGNSLNFMTWAFQMTGDSRYRNTAEFVVSNGVYFANPVGTSPLDTIGSDALGRYVSTLREADDTHLDPILENMVSTPEVIHKNAWDFLRSDTYGWASMVLPKKRNYQTTADHSFASGVQNPAWANNGYGISRVWQIKEWVTHIKAGHAYQLAVYDAKGGPKFSPGASPIPPFGGAPVQNQPPSAAIAGGSSVSGVTDEPVAFVATASDPDSPASSLRFLWDFGDGVSASGQNVNHTFRTSGSWIVHLWVSDGESAFLTKQTANISFSNHAPEANAGPDRTAPVGVSILFDGSGSSDVDEQPLTYSWNFGDGNTATGITASHVYNSAGNYTVVLTVSDGSLPDTDSAAVKINPVSGTPVTKTFQQGVDGYTGMKDTRLWCCVGAPYNYGADPELFIGRQNYPELNSLIQFNLTGIPQGARIDRADLQVSVSRTGSTAAVEVHRVTQDWIEGTGCCTSDGATWRLYDGANAWENEGGDFGSSIDASFSAPASSGSVTVNVTSIVQNWTLGTPNYGFAFVLTQAVNYQAVFLHSSEASTLSLRPRLTVQYTPLAENPPPSITSFNPVSGPVGTTVQIAGSNFTGTSSVKFNGKTAVFQIVSATVLTATVPKGAVTGPLSVTTPNGTATSSTNFTVTKKRR